MSAAESISLGGAKTKPQIPEVLPNVTVAVGRDATLPCVVKNLQDYKVSERYALFISQGTPLYSLPSTHSLDDSAFFHHPRPLL